MQSSRYQIEPFTPQFREVSLLLKPLPHACFKVYYLMLQEFRVEEDLSDDTWVRGVIRATVREVARRLGFNYGWLRTKTWPLLEEVGVVVYDVRGIIELPRYKKLKDQYLIPGFVKKQIMALITEVNTLKSAVFEESGAEVGANADKSAGNRHSKRRLPALKARETGTIGSRPILLNSQKIKKDRSLSPDQLLRLFYDLIKVKRVEKSERERGLTYVKGLLEQGYKAELIEHAIRWTVDQATQPLRSIKILSSTIHQAERDWKEQRDREQRLEETEQHRQSEVEKYEAEQEESERMDKEISKLSKKQYTALQEEALQEVVEELEKSGVDLESLGVPEVLVKIKAKEILRRRMEEV